VSLTQAELKHLSVGRLDVTNEAPALAGLLCTFVAGRANAMAAFHVAYALLFLMADRAGQLVLQHLDHFALAVA